MKKAEEIIEGAGVRGIMLLLAIRFTGRCDVKGVMAALAALGQAAGAGCTLYEAGIVAEAMDKYGFEQLFERAMDNALNRGETCQSMVDEIESCNIFPAIKERMIRHIKAYSK